MIASESTDLPSRACTLPTPGRSAGVDRGHQRIDPRGCGADTWTI